MDGKMDIFKPNSTVPDDIQNDLDIYNANW